MVGSILVFLLVLSILVLVHETGHFLVARKMGVWVEEFGFGLPPRVFGKKIGQTIYSINLLPFGGFVRLHGENLEEDIKNPKMAFLEKSKKARIAIVTAGVIMNFILAVVAFSISYSFAGIPRETNNVKVIDVASGSPAQIAGVIAGDTIKNIDGTTVSSTQDFISLVEAKKGKKINVEISRDGVSKKFNTTPRENPPQGEGALGITISATEIYFAPLWQRPLYGIYYGFKEATYWGRTVLQGFYTLFAGLFKGEVPKDVSGPVGIYAVTTEVAKYGLLSLINFIGILSVNLAILNILPFPALDGGRLLFIFLEKLIGRRVLPKVESAIHTVGMVILLALILLITIGDVQKLIKAGSLSGFLDNMMVK
jgi:regulator of sigma E protease